VSGVLLGGLVVAPAAPAAAATCAGGVSDFNGDGVTDTIVADPQATVNGAKRAGLVRVLFGGGKGSVELTQASPGLATTPERGDQFGQSTAFTDIDSDGCSDLVVGAPLEDVPRDGENLVDAGVIAVFHGSPTNFGTGAKVDSYAQDEFDAGSAAEAYDRFGFALQGGTASSGEPYLLIGVPGENLTIDGTSYADAGVVDYQLGTKRYAVHQDTPGVPGVVEAHDEFGSSLAGTNRFFAVGAPGEAIGTEEFAGAVTVFAQSIVDGHPKALVGIDQNTSGVSGDSEAGDVFGTTVDMTNYRPSDQTYNSDALLAVGVPAEEISGKAGMGMVHVLRIEPDGKIAERAALSPDATDVDGTGAAADHFGQDLAIDNLDTGVVTASATMRLAVGIPGRDTGGTDAGVIQVFRPLDSNPGSADKIISRGSTTLPGTATSRDYLGTALHSGSVNLYVGVPFSKAADSTKGVLYVTPWTDVDSGTKPATVLKPGTNGIPDAGATFGELG
jgi:hypothetical protein